MLVVPPGTRMGKLVVKPIVPVEPSCPDGLTNTKAALVKVVPLIPAMKVLVWTPAVPRRMVLFSFVPGLPI